MEYCAQEADDPFWRFLMLAESAARDLQALPVLEEAAEEAKSAQAAAEAEAAAGGGPRQTPKQSQLDDVDRVSLVIYISAATIRSGGSPMMCTVGST